MKRVPGSRRRKTIDMEKLLDVALDDKCKGGKFQKRKG